MNLGFIGTGEITKAVVIGILKSKIKYKKIYISKRNRKISNFLKIQNKNIKVVSDNQEIINKSHMIFLAVTPDVGNKIIKKLKFKNTQTIVSFISTIKYADLKKYIRTKSKIVRAIPLPPIAIGTGPVPIYPPNKKVRIFFDKIGKTIEINNEKLSLNFWTMSSMMAPYYEMLNHLTTWLINKGLTKQKAERYITSLFFGLSKNAYLHKYENLKELVKKSQTPNGLNEQALKELKRINFYVKLSNTSNNILKRLKGK